MPLPPAPTKRAALLSPDAHDAPARSSHRGSRRSGESRADSASSSGSQPLELFDRNTAEAVGGSAEAAPSARGRSKPAPSRNPERNPERGNDRSQEQRPAARGEPEAPPAAYVPAPSPVAAPQVPTRSKRAKSNGAAKLFVLDTNVLLHDPMCLFRFEEHDIFLPMIVLEELDGH